jgi:hypothetical protein
MDGLRTGRWVQNVATPRRVGGSCRFPGLGVGHWRRATGADSGQTAGQPAVRRRGSLYTHDTRELSHETAGI